VAGTTQGPAGAAPFDAGHHRRAVRARAPPHRADRLHSLCLKDFPMTRTFKMVTFQASVLATAGLMMFAAADVASAAPTPAAAVQIGNFTFKAPVTTVKVG